MKTLNTIFLSIAASLLMSACTSSDHMTFWGGPIDGPKQEFVRKMLKKTDAVVQDNIGNQTLIGLSSMTIRIVTSWLSNRNRMSML